MLSMEEFSKLFDTVYNVLYNAGGLVDYSDAVDRFYLMSKIRPEFEAKIREFETYRQDWITSDRECAAFVIAYFWEG